jgi:broad specificity phosphatase PhoE
MCNVVEESGGFSESHCESYRRVTQRAGKALAEVKKDPRYSIFPKV